VDHRARRSSREDDGAPEREDQRRHGEGRAGALLDVQDQREGRHEIAKCREAGRAGEETEVATAWNRHAPMPCANAVRYTTVEACWRSDSQVVWLYALTRTTLRRPRRSGRAPCSPISRSTPVLSIAAGSRRVSGPTCSTS